MKLQVNEQSYQILSNCHLALKTCDISKLRTNNFENKDLRNFANANKIFPFIKESFGLFDQHHQCNYSNLIKNLEKTTYSYSQSMEHTKANFFVDGSIELQDNHSETGSFSDVHHFIKIHHEYYHLLSTSIKDSFFFSGFSCSSEYGETVGRGLNEGSTDMLVYKDLKIDIPFIAYIKDNNFSNVHLNFGYSVENSLSSSLCDIIGEEKFRRYYNAGNLTMLVEELLNYQSRTEIMKWIRNFDKMHNELELKRINKGALPTQTITEVRDFLIDTFENKRKSSILKPDSTRFYDNIIQYVGGNGVPCTNKVLSLGITL